MCVDVLNCFIRPAKHLKFFSLPTTMKTCSAMYKQGIFSDVYIVYDDVLLNNKIIIHSKNKHLRVTTFLTIKNNSELIQKVIWYNVILTGLSWCEMRIRIRIQYQKNQWAWLQIKIKVQRKQIINSFCKKQATNTNLFNQKEKIQIQIYRLN